MPVTTAIAELLLAACVGALLVVTVGLPWHLRRNRRSFESGVSHREEAARAEQRVVEERLDARERDAARLEQARLQLESERERLLAENRALGERTASLDSDVRSLRDQLERTTVDAERTRAVAGAAALREAELGTRLAETERTFAEKEALFTRTGEMLKLEFESLAQRIFDEQGQKFTRTSKTELDGLLAPFRDQLSDFRQKVEQVHLADTRERASLLNEVRNLQNASERINVEAENLTRALKGDKKLQGNWGELVLERVLDDSGLRRDHEYTLQASRRDESGDATKRPDAIIHLPDDKDIVVDSKVSLVAYERALTATDDAEREREIRQHVQDLRAQVRRLADQDYDRLSGVRSLDFVLLFVPVESAFTLAMQHDAGLFADALRRRIVVVSPTTLMMTLRIIHNVWRHEKQNRNAQEIANRAGQLYDKLRVAVDDLLRLGGTLRHAEEAYQDAMKKLATGKGNLVRQVEQLRELGAPVKRPFAREVLDRADDEGDLPTAGVDGTDGAGAD